MAGLGPKPTPTALRLVQGNPSKRPINKLEPKPVRGIPRCPAHMDRKAKTAWRNLCKLLDGMGVLTLADSLALEMLCSVYARIRDLQKEIKAQGSTTYELINRDGVAIKKALPSVGQLEKAEITFRGYLVEFGLTPSSRSKVSATEKKSEDDILDQYGV